MPEDEEARRANIFPTSDTGAPKVLGIKGRNTRLVLLEHNGDIVRAPSHCLHREGHTDESMKNERRRSTQMQHLQY